jgi:hypothetical protein
MSKASRISANKSEIENYFDALPQKIFNSPELLRIFTDNKEAWELPVSIGFEKFVEFLLTNSRLKKVELHSERYQNIFRYSWGEPSIYALALSIKSNSFLTHGSAAFLHGLAEENPNNIYVNYEQSPKPQYGSSLAQDGIHRAFAKQQRQTNLIYAFDGKSIIVINGKNTGRSGLCGFTEDDGSNPLAVTDLERTLIDITVRPSYAGNNTLAVLEAYKRAKDKLDIKTLLKMLEKFDYIYPYHQAIGFFMERAGYPKKSWSKLLGLGTNFDFYVAHQLPEEERLFDDKWRVFYPQELK